MGVAKYSPTVGASYARDQQWWKRNGGGYGNGRNPGAEEDDDGFDSYGYSDGGSGPDRAGHTEEQYGDAEWEDGREPHYVLYERVSDEWRSRLLGDLAEG